jgi:hypothetical protein
MDIQQFLTPENITLAAGVAGGIIAVAFIILIIMNRKTLGSGIASLWQSIFSQGGLFYFGMGLFMIASVVEAGPVINKIAMHGALWGYGGHMLIFAFDTVAAVCLRARLNARRVADKQGMKVQMWGIWLPALVSIAANLAGAIQSFDANDFNHLWLFAWLLPLIGAVFPSMIVVLSLAADHMIDTTAITKRIDVKEFEAQELKRVEVLKVRLKVETELMAEEKRIAEVRRERDEAQKVEATREWFFMHWLRPEKMASMKGQIEAAVHEARDSWMKQSTAQIEAMKAEMKRAMIEAQTAWTQQSGQQRTAVSTGFTEVQQALTQLTEQLAQLSEGYQGLVQRIEKQDEQLHSLKLNAHTMMKLQRQIEGMVLTVEGLKLNTNGASTFNGAASKTGKKMKLRDFASLEVEAGGDTDASLSAVSTDGASTSREQRAFNFMAEYAPQHHGAEPSLEDIMAEVQCSQGSASNYRAKYRKSQLASVSSNGHKEEHLHFIPRE